MKLGVIGGSGLYEIEGLSDLVWTKVQSSFGDPSDDFLTGKLNGEEIVFLPRHGRGHFYSPTTVPYRANIDALKKLGVTHIISISAVGSLNEVMEPGHFVIVEQFIDRTFARDKSFFGSGCVAHVSLAHPTCSLLSQTCYDVATKLGIEVHAGGVYLAMEGPQFSTKAESYLYKNDFNCDVIGMTNMPEAKLAREAEIHYASVAMVTDFDCWHPGHAAVTVADIIENLNKNSMNAKRLIVEITKFIGNMKGECREECDKALEFAIITDRSKIPIDVKNQLRNVAGRILG